MITKCNFSKYSEKRFTLKYPDYEMSKIMNKTTQLK